MNAFWQIAAASSGLGAVGAFVYLSLCTHWLGTDVFCPLTSKQTFLLMLAFLILAFFALLAMLGTFLLARNNRGREGGERNGG